MGFVYYIGCPESCRIKIGFTKGNPYARLAALQTGSPTRLALIAVQEGSVNDERLAHERFAAHRSHGEWFSMSEELFLHLSMIVFVKAVQLENNGEPIPRWVSTGLTAINSDNDLPEELAVLCD